ncbi:MAG: TetR/AcrR family transcriptional regulator [Rectinemataceae bacterium]
MPRAFTPAEKARIKDELIRAASTAIAEKGFRKSSIDHIVQAAHISKGAFYLFYASKELLIFDAIRSEQTRAREILLKGVEEPLGQEAGELVERFLSALFDTFTELPLLREIAKPGVMPDLLRGLPAEAMDEEYESDERFFESIFKRLKRAKILTGVNYRLFAGIPRIVWALETNKDMIGLERYDEIKKLLIRGLARELIAGDGRHADAGIGSEGRSRRSDR